jgi:hypothetical protein
MLSLPAQEQQLAAFMTEIVKEPYLWEIFL